MSTMISPHSPYPHQLPDGNWIDLTMLSMVECGMNVDRPMVQITFRDPVGVRIIYFGSIEDARICRDEIGNLWRKAVIPSDVGTSDLLVACKALIAECLDHERDYHHTTRDGVLRQARAAIAKAENTAKDVVG